MKMVSVIGAGVAGLSAAKVLAEHFDDVVVYDGGSAAQSKHLHVLMKSGQMALERIFPATRQKLLKAGCTEIDWAQDTLWENDSGIFPRYPSSLKTLSMIYLTYRTYLFDRKDLNLNGMKQYYFQIDPPLSSIGGVITSIEDGNAMVTIIEEEGAPSSCFDFESFLEKARRIPGNKFLEIIQDARPISGMATFSKKRTHRRRLLVHKLPERILVLGDVLTSLNPIFGQGMSLALMQVEVLKQMLEQGNLNSKHFHDRCYKLGKLPYLMSHIGSKESGLSKKLFRKYLSLCQSSRLLHQVFLRLLHSLGRIRRPV